MQSAVLLSVTYNKPLMLNVIMQIVVMMSVVMMSVVMMSVVMMSVVAPCGELNRDERKKKVTSR
jgi:hypothetical protein